MDTSETYIKMCDCPEIQGEWEPKVGDWVGHTGSSPQPITVISCIEEWRGSPISLGENYGLSQKSWLIYLPRQGQLQEMLSQIIMKRDNEKLNFTYHLYTNKNISDEKLWFKFQKLYHIHDETDKDFYFIGDTPEQALIQGVMHELHGKARDGEKWI